MLEPEPLWILHRTLRPKSQLENCLPCVLLVDTLDVVVVYELEFSFELAVVDTDTVVWLRVYG